MGIRRLVVLNLCATALLVPYFLTRNRASSPAHQAGVGASAAADLGAGISWSRPGRALMHIAAVGAAVIVDLGQTPSARIMVALDTARSAAFSVSTAQNIGWGLGSAATPAGIVRAWMHSAPHRRIMLTRAFHKAGVGVASALPRELGHGAAGATYAVEFAAR